MAAPLDSTPVSISRDSRPIQCDPLDGLRFATPYALILLLIPPALALYYWRSRRVAAAVSLGASTPAEAAPRTWRIRLGPLLPGLRVLSVALLVVALARPQSGHAEGRPT